MSLHVIHCFSVLFLMYSLHILELILMLIINDQSNLFKILI